jgi:5-methylcytosine-specific restriction endonuclease McrA
MQDFRTYTNQQLGSAVKELVTRGKELDLLLIKALIELTQRDLHLKKGYSSVKSYLEGEHQMSEDQAAKRSQVVNLLRHHPMFFELLRDGKTHLSHLAACAPKVTQKNAQIVKDFIPGKTRQDILFFLSCLNPDGSFDTEQEEVIEIKIRCPKSLLEKFERARSFVKKDFRGATNEAVLERAIENFLDKVDPLRRAERAAKRGEPRCAGATKVDAVDECSKPAGPEKPKVLGAGRHIPNRIRHAVYLRDKGRCTYVSPDGKLCCATVGLSIDHICLYSRGGDHSLKNLRLLCLAHNNYLATVGLGREFMANYVERLAVSS